jgi:hypothetical protein
VTEGRFGGVNSRRRASLAPFGLVLSFARWANRAARAREELAAGNSRCFTGARRKGTMEQGRRGGGCGDQAVPDGGDAGSVAGRRTG